LNSHELSDEELPSFVAKFDIERVVESSSLAVNMFTTIMNNAMKVDTETTTLSFIIRDYLEGVKTRNKVMIGSADGKLSLYGIRAEIEGAKIVLYVRARHNEQLASLAPRSDREAIDFEGILLQQPGAHKVAKSMRIGGIVTRAVAVPLDVSDFYEESEEKGTSVVELVKRTMTDLEFAV
jgi:hypothetical protein